MKANETETDKVELMAVPESGGGFDMDFHAVLKRLATVRWRETMFEDLDWYYAEDRTYVLRCKKGDANEHYCIIRARSADEAISRAVFDLHKSGEQHRIGDAGRLRPALQRLYDFWAAHGGAYAVQVAPVRENEQAVEDLRQHVLAGAKDALAAAPARNFDAFGDEELFERFDAFCSSHCDFAGKTTKIRCRNCPLKESGDGCIFAFARLPAKVAAGGAE